MSSSAAEPAAGGDLEGLVLATVASDPYLLTKALDEGLRPEFHFDKNRDAPEEVSPSIQYAFFVHENKFVELDYKTEEQDRADFRGFAKAQDIHAFLAEKGHLDVG